MSASLIGPDRPQYYQSSTGLWLPATIGCGVIRARWLGAGARAGRPRMV
jgi:hypothetical protein